MFEGVDIVLHAGDVGGESVLDGLREIAPVYAVFGNNDAVLGNLGLSEHVDIECAGVRLHVVHELRRAKPSPETQVVVFGHSHRQVVEWRNDVLYINPGAAGRRGFHRLQTAALLRIEDGRLEPQLLELGPRLRPAGTKSP